MQSIVDFALWAWMEDVDGFVSSRRAETPDWNSDCYNLRLEALNACPRPLLLETLRRMDRRFHLRLATTFCRRCTEWGAAHKLAYQEDPSKVDCLFFSCMIGLVQYLTAVPAFTRALSKAGFHSLAVRLAMDFRHSPTSIFSQELEPSKRGTLAAEITSHFLGLWLGDAKIARLIPEILEAGLLQTIVDDLYSLARGMKTLHKWVDLNEGQPTPLQWIGRDVTFHPDIARSLFAAIDATLATTAEDVWKEPVVAEHWAPFLASLEVHRMALSKYEHETFKLCDNLEVSSGSSVCIHASYWLTLWKILASPQGFRRCHRSGMQELCQVPYCDILLFFLPTERLGDDS